MVSGFLINVYRAYDIVFVVRIRKGVFGVKRM